MRAPLLIPLIWMAAACATTGTTPDPLAKVTIAELKPPLDSSIGTNTTLRVVVDYTLGEFKPGRDRLSLVFKIRGGGTWEPARQAVTQARGRVTFELAGGDLVNNAALARPVQMLVALDRWDGSQRTLAVAGSAVVVLSVDQSASELEARAKLLSPSVGKGQLLSDVFNDPAVKPYLPPSLNTAGRVVWGLYKVCVDTEGDVASVRAIKPADPEAEESWRATIRRWKHRPYTLDGKAEPYCYPLRLEVRASY